MMRLPGSKRRYVGVEIEESGIRNAVISHRNGFFFMEKFSFSPLPDNTFKASFRKENILDPGKFRRAFKKSLHASRIKRGNLAISLPNESVKILIRHFAALPRDKAGKDEMVNWNITSTLGLSTNDIKISWQYMGMDAEDKYVLLISFACQNVLDQYESEIKKMGFNPQIISSAGAHQFNFFSSLLSESGVVAYVGLFEPYITIWIFIDSVPVFYKMVKKGLLTHCGKSAGNTSQQCASGLTDENAHSSLISGSERSAQNGEYDGIAEEVDLLFHYFDTGFPDIRIEKIFITPQPELVDFMQNYFLKNDDAMQRNDKDRDTVELSVLGETQLIQAHKITDSGGENMDLLPYTASMGAAFTLR